MTLTVIGLDGSPTAPAALTSATLVAGARRHLDSVQIPLAARVVVMGDVSAALDEVATHQGNAVVLASGDPGFFGIVRLLRERGLEPEVLPAVSSVAAAFARVALSWDDALVVSAHGRPIGPVAAACRAHPKVAVLTSSEAGPAELGAALAGSGRRLVVATSLGTPREAVVEVSAEEAAARPWQQPAVVLVMDPSARPDMGWIAGGERVPDGWALPESAFDHRDSMVTKAEVRALALAHLAPRTGTVVWDLGTGSGSVAVECARFGADVVAVDKDADACARVAANARTHGVTVDVVNGTMPDVLQTLREPDSVFVGGGGLSTLEGALKVGRPLRVVATLASVERVGSVLELLAHQGFSTGGTQLAASRLSMLPDWLKSGEAAQLVGEAIGNVPGVGFLLKRIGGWIIDRTKRAYLLRSRETLQMLFNDGELKRPYELSALLPWVLAEDLNHHLAVHPADRFVLFIDEYERVFAGAGAGVRWQEKPFDNHVRTFVQHAKGLLAVFFSRERLPWEHYPEWRDDLVNAQYRLGGLAEGDADQFLRGVPIDAVDIREAIIESAREGGGQKDAYVYPLMIDMQVEHWRMLCAKKAPLAREQFKVTAPTFEGRCREIVRRALREYDLPLQTTIERLSVARRFDREAFAHLIKTFGTGLPVDALDLIANLSFVTREPDGFFSMHHVIAQTIAETLSVERRQASIEALFQHYSARAIATYKQDVTEPVIAALIEAAFLRRLLGADGLVAWLEEKVRPISIMARYSVAAQLWREAAEFVQAHLGDLHPDFAWSLVALGRISRDQGDLNGARQLFEQAEGICKTALGEDHEQTNTTIIDLALALYDLGDFGRARPLLEHSLAVCEKSYGPDDPDTATMLNNLGCLLIDQGDLSRARQNLERALAIRTRVLGPEHTITAQSHNNLGALLLELDDLETAQKHLECAIAIYQETFGAEHPHTAAAVATLAGVFAAKGDLKSAHQLLERSVNTRETILGPDHPDTASALHNLAHLLEHEGNLSAAQPLVERALTIFEKTFGAEHHLTASSLANLGALLRGQRKYDEARPILERALAIRERILGSDHHSTANSLDNLGSLLHLEGDLAGARPLVERAFAIYESVLGPGHDDTLICMDNLAVLLGSQGELAGARLLFERALSIHEKKFDPHHPYIIPRLGSLAEIVKAQGDLGGARDLLTRALAICEKNYGADNPEILDCINNLLHLLIVKGDLTEARVLLERTLTISGAAVVALDTRTTQSLYKVTERLQAEGDLTAARDILKRALAVDEKALGPDHPELAGCLTHLGRVVQAQGDMVAARCFFERALKIRDAAANSEDIITAAILNNLALLAHAQGDLSYARKLLDRALAIVLKELDTDQWFVNNVVDNLSAVLHQQDDPAGERALLEHVLSVREQALGPNHLTLLVWLGNYGQLLVRQEDFSAARDLFARAVAIIDSNFPPGHAK